MNHVYAFPRQTTGRASEDELRACALGYRAKNLRARARLVSRGNADFEGWRSLSDDELR